MFSLITWGLFSRILLSKGYLPVHGYLVRAVYETEVAIFRHVTSA